MLRLFLTYLLTMVHKPGHTQRVQLLIKKFHTLWAEKIPLVHIAKVWESQWPLCIAPKWSESWKPVSKFTESMNQPEKECYSIWFINCRSTLLGRNHEQKCKWGSPGPARWKGTGWPPGARYGTCGQSAKQFLHICKNEISENYLSIILTILKFFLSLVPQ